MVDQREAVQTVARGYLTEAYPERVAEFDSTFESIYTALQKRETATGRNGRAPNGEGVSFEGGAGESAIVGMACVVGYAIVRATLKDMAKRDLPKILDEVEARLSRLTGRPELVSAIRRRMEGILQSM